MESIVGHKKIKQRLNKAIEKGSISHAFLFCGPENVGKFSLAWEFSRKLLQQSSAKEMEMDVLVVRPEVEAKGEKKTEKAIGIESIREVQRRLSLTSFQGKRKIAIIDKADKLTIGAQNALLKILEEPSEGTIIILVTSRERKVLDTVSSRCQKIKFSLVSESDIDHEILKDVSNKEAILFWSLGRPGLAINLMNEKGEMEFRKELFSDFKMLFQREVGQKFILAEKLSKDTSLALRKLELWEVILRRALLSLDRRITIPRAKSLVLIEKLEEAALKLKDTNANARLVLENLFLSF